MTIEIDEVVSDIRDVLLKHGISGGTFTLNLNPSVAHGITEEDLVALGQPKPAFFGIECKFEPPLGFSCTFS
ncbi:hypothetical protein NJC38_02765 [Pseudomonas sp. 21LCFQ010]|uniref:hypothetical protein n=1 Tax=Pseudomonas sp. 21LCFQ010 TaxID=2957506 RepID=UPI002096DF68|nr:hypothetical protein [Pseudomonas sp. 21LCFQ010]MCO8161073.1 hypothetical protein [Pseudomonas sp. 21LCFQ010]